MLDKKDAQWWVSEVERHPESAVNLIRLLADRLAFLDKQNEALRGELIALRRKQGGEAASAARADREEAVSELTQRVRQLESALQQGSASKHVLVYGPDRIEMTLPAVSGAGVNRAMPDDVKVLVCEPDAQLLI